MPTEQRSGPHDVRRARRRGALRNPVSYHEGEAAALAEAMRIVTTAGPVEAFTALHEALALWTHRANSLSASPSPALRAYHQGGRDALQAFLEAQQHDAEHRHLPHG
ncbi:hypothetical protein [Phycicoccus sp. SLBN-51]|uniref:hypothetical protein n=1 Tax=Phycicoccus sp. SLBN-51 TaxID=2768447 RepID=UPI00115232D7|nr:hypothetical protein [Phycicoccus sp. SLBN-51]